VLKQTRQEEARQQIQNQTDAIAREMLAALGEQSGAQLAGKKGAPIIRIPNQTLFVPSSGYLSDSGKALLRPLAQIIKTQSASFSFKLVGFTDSAKPSPALAKAYGSNKQISATRARNAAEFLTRESGLPPGSIASEGQGALSPVAPSQTSEGRARNQRLEIMVQSRLGAENQGEGRGL
jgi:flagellar motor protein MotB